MFTVLKNSAAALFVTLFILLISSFLVKPTASEWYISHWDGFNSSIENLQSALKSKKDVKIAFDQAKEKFKKIEFLINYFDSESVKRYLNGPPLHYQDVSSERPIALPPVGLQVIEELVYDTENLTKNLPEITRLVQLLSQDSKTLYKYHKGIKIEYRHLFEASKNQILRIAFMSITGFDTPSSGLAIPLSKSSLGSVSYSYTNFLSDIIKTKNEKLDLDIKKLFDSTLHYLSKNPEFDSFDRFVFISNYLEPLHGLIVEAHKVSGYETVYETTTQIQAVNYFSKSFWSTDFLNKEYYLFTNKKLDQKAVVKLGKTLFYDPILSSNNKRSCASCHNPNRGFTDGSAKSMAFDFKGTVTRNSPTLINAIYADKYFHDMRSEELPNQIEQVVHSAAEFNTNFNEICSKIADIDEYKSLFKQTFKDDTDPVSKTNVNYALSQFVGSLAGFNSYFDKMIRKEIPTNYDVKNGFNVFMGKGACGTCHFGPTFSGLVPPFYTDNESEVLGVPDVQNQLDQDLGRYLNNISIDNIENFKFSFKTPTVRNTELSAPYMHNGVFMRLREVMNFYNKGGGLGLGIAPAHQTLPFDSLGLNNTEVSQVILFMKTLTDTTGMTSIPSQLPGNTGKYARKIGGEY